jgi:hypothetical protein
MKNGPEVQLNLVGARSSRAAPGRRGSFLLLLINLVLYVFFCERACEREQL